MTDGAEKSPTCKGMNASARIALLAVLFIAAVLPGFFFPHPYEMRDVDEIGYMDAGLLVWEGIGPNVKASVNSPETWFGWVYAAAQTAKNLAMPVPPIRSAPMLVRPYLAIDRALFDTYQDLSGLHRYLLSITFLISLAGVYAAFRLGHLYGR